MESIKAVMRGNGLDQSVEFSIEEVIQQHRGKPWAEMTQQEQQTALKEYAGMLFSRQGGALPDGNPDIALEGGTFSKVEDGAV